MTEPVKVASTPRVLGQRANGAPQGDTIDRSEDAYTQAYYFRTDQQNGRLRAATRKALGRV